MPSVIEEAADVLVSGCFDGCARIFLIMLIILAVSILLAAYFIFFN
jgi:hypothetical protein